MNKSIALGLSMIALAIVCAPASANLITFDDTGIAGYGMIPDGYAGFDWDNLWVLDAVSYSGNPSGYLNGLVSPSHVAFNGYGSPAEFSGDPFTLTGAYLTGAWNDGLKIDITGYRLGSPVHSRTVEVDTTGPTWVQLDYTNVDRVRFVSYGGTENPNLDGGGQHFAMDNLVYTRIPAPGAVVLVGLGTTLVGLLRRRKTL